MTPFELDPSVPLSDQERNFNTPRTRPRCDRPSVYTRCSRHLPQERNFITELLFGYDSFPHWDGDSCLAGTPAQFPGVCKYSPPGNVITSNLRMLLHHAGLKECESGAECVCTGCDQLNEHLKEGGSLTVPTKKSGHAG